MSLFPRSTPRLNCSRFKGIAIVVATVYLSLHHSSGFVVHPLSAVRDATSFDLPSEETDLSQTTRSWELDINSGSCVQYNIDAIATVSVHV